jgi:mono/diheme cytochrome c family protein
MKSGRLGLVLGLMTLAAVLVGSAPKAAGRQTAAAATPVAGGPSTYQPVVEKYCVTCHNDRLKTGGLSLQGHDLSAVVQDAELWEKVVRKLSNGQMPPLGAPKLDAATTGQFVTALTTTLDRAAARHPNPGHPMIHRLNRSEYANAVRDLLRLNIDVTGLLPADELSSGFDNIADALGVSPLLIERYLTAADRVAATAVGDPEIVAGSDTFVPRGDTQQLDHIEGLPLGTRGGLLIKQTFPLDATYVISAKLYQTNNGFTRGLAAPHDLEFSVDGERVFLNTVGGPEDFANLMANPAYAEAVDKRLTARVPIKAGAHVVGVTFVRKTGALNVSVYKPLQAPVDTVDSDGAPKLDSVTIRGPFDVTGPGDTASRRQIFSCRPSTQNDERACASTIATTLSRRAFRRPVSTEDVARLMKYYDLGRVKAGGFESGVQMVVRRILSDPEFLFRVERDPVNVPVGTPYKVGDLELASRLSFFLWSSIPDDTLLQLATQKQLHDPTVFAAQVKRMLADPKADALVSNFAGQWLQLRNLQRSSPDLMEFPDFDDGLRQGFRQETEMFFASLLRGNRSVLELLTADYTFVNERLARHYGIPGVAGSAFRRVTVTDESRRGLLGQGSMLLVTSHPNRTSPVKRGKWILENLLGAPPPPPPPNVPPLVETKDADHPMTMKERMEEHRRNPVCANCHRLMDPIGLALENYDGIGAARVRDHGVKIDASTQLADGTSVDGVNQLRQAILKRSDIFVRTFTENLLTYAVGRGLGGEDMPAVRTILRNTAPQHYRMEDIVQAIVTSTPFQMRIKPAAAGEAAH